MEIVLEDAEKEARRVVEQFDKIENKVESFTTKSLQTGVTSFGD